MRLIMLLSLLLSQTLFAQTSPVGMLEQSANQILTTLKENQAKLKTNPHIIHQAIEHYLLPHVDLTGMSRSVLGRQAWTKATAAEKKAFTQAFTQLVIRTYANPLAEYSGETVKFSPLHGSENAHFVRVNSQIIRRNGPSIPLSYSLVFKQGAWKVYDLSVEGVSLLQSFHAQFAQALQSSSLETLIKTMNKKQKAA